MTPFLPLVIFFMATAVAITAFVWLTFKESTPRIDDWKKFLGPFTATALALAVGFLSLTLQQSYQSDQNRNEQRIQFERRQDEENGQLKARLLYSVAQKKWE